MQNTKNTFFAKAIENWLTNTNELGYQLSFCQLLLNEGLRIVHISKHNAFEQGKDIIAKDSGGVVHVYQLKGGNIGLTDWRNIVKAEIEELIELTVVHPGVKKNSPFVPYLVTNGYLDDTVRVQIENLNASKWSSNPLQVILLGDLLARFIEWSYEFTPREISNYKTFLDLYFADGSELIKEQEFAVLLESILRLTDQKSVTKAQRSRNIGASVLLAGYLISPLKERDNHIGLMQALTILASYILAMAEKSRLPDKYWKPSFDLVWTELTQNFERLENEINETGLVDLYQNIWDGELAPYRRHMAMSYLIAGKLSQLLRSDNRWSSFENNKTLEVIMKEPIVAGEASLMGFVYLYHYLSKLGTEGRDAYILLALQLLIFFNGRNGILGLPNPYYGVETAIRINLGLVEADEINDDFFGRSFLLKSLIELLVQANRRDLLESLWREISYIQMERFEPKELWGYFVWRTRNGLNASEFPKATQSWAELRDQATIFDACRIPNLLKKVPYFTPMFLLVFPHRATPNVMKFLSSLISAA